LLVIGRKLLLEGGQRFGCGKQLETWLRIAQEAEWKSLADVQKTYASADGVPVGEKTYTVFNIRGNHFRLIVEIEYQYQRIFVKHVLTHAEYSKENWKK
jgi:mRNA interferase HigB